MQRKEVAGMHGIFHFISTFNARFKTSSMECVGS